MWPNPQFPADLVTFTDKILNGKPDDAVMNSYDQFIVSAKIFYSKYDSHLSAMDLFLTSVTEIAFRKIHKKLILI